MQGFFKEFTMRTDVNEYNLAEKYAIAHGLDLEGAVILFIRELAQGNVPTYIKNSHSKAPDDFTSWLLREGKMYTAMHLYEESQRATDQEDIDHLEERIKELYSKYSKNITAPDDFETARNAMLALGSMIPSYFYDDRDEE